MITVTYCNCLVVSTTHFLDDGPPNDPQGWGNIGCGKSLKPKRNHTLEPFWWGQHLQLSNRFQWCFSFSRKHSATQLYMGYIQLFWCEQKVCVHSRLGKSLESTSPTTISLFFFPWSCCLAHSPFPETESLFSASFEVVASAQEALKDVHDGATLCIGTSVDMCQNGSLGTNENARKNHAFSLNIQDIQGKTQLNGVNSLVWGGIPHSHRRPYHKIRL